MNDAIDPHNLMLQALALAKRGQNTVSPNPMVGCCIVQNNEIVGCGYHQCAGDHHAEIYALQEAGAKAVGATVYVTLEPCCHHGKTPPCVDALIQAKIRKVYVACQDPNPAVAGKGIAALRAAGIEVDLGVCEQSAQQVNEIFFHYMIHQRPFVIAKWAMSLDGKTCVNPPDDRKISCAASHQHTHQTRQQVDAILIGATTLIQDDPQLTARLGIAPENLAKQPIRIIVTSRGDLPLSARLFHSTMPGKTIIATTEAISLARYQPLLTQNNNIEILILPKTATGQVALPALLQALGKRQITSLLVEGGMTMQQSFFAENLVNKVQVYLAPYIVGVCPKKQPITHLTSSALSADFYLTGYVEKDIHV